MTFTSVTIASDELSVGETVRWIAAARRYFASRCEQIVFVEKAADIRAAHAAGKIAVNPHFQGSNPLGGDLNMVDVYRQKWYWRMLLAYNYRNLAGDGCHELNDAGLSVFGRELIAEMNRVKMIVDLTRYRGSTVAGRRRSE